MKQSHWSDENFQSDSIKLPEGAVVCDEDSDVLTKVDELLAAHGLEIEVFYDLESSFFCSDYPVIRIIKREVGNEQTA